MKLVNPLSLLRLDALTGTAANSWKSEPWKIKHGPGIYMTSSNDVWVYFILPLASIEYEDPNARLSAQSKIDRLLVELGDTSRDLGQGLSAMAQRRDIHILSVLYEEPSKVSKDTAEALAELQQQMLYYTTTNKLLAIGVKLRRDAFGELTNSESDESASKRLKSAVKSKTDTSLTAFAADMHKIKALVGRAGGRAPTLEEAAWLESWFNNANGTDTRIAATDTKLYVADGTSWQIAALWGVDELDMKISSPWSPWVMDAMNHPDGANVVSIRSSLEPATVTRGRSRKSQRILRAQEEEELATGDVSRDEITDKAHMAKSVENYIREAGTAWLSGTSVLFARKTEGPGELPPDETFADILGAWYGFNIKPLEKRQLAALKEMLPGTNSKVNPFGQDVNTAWVSYSGINAFGSVGDKTGMLLAEAAPHSTPVYVEEFGAANHNKGPAMCIFGRPGSGKTFAAQILAGQAAIGGGTSILINPKGHDSLASFAHWVKQQGAPATVISLSALTEEGGAFDPFRFSEPVAAAEILSRHIINSLGSAYKGGLDGRQEIELRRGLIEGAQNGARCARDAIRYVKDPMIIDMVEATAESSALFQLGYGYVPGVPWGAGSGFTLIEFDRDMGWPAAGKNPASYDLTEREAVGALRIISRASIEILMRSGGGTLVVDEAHHFLASPEGRATIDRIIREGRSLKLLPIFCTQRVTDLVGGDNSVDMETFLSRVLALSLPDKAEAKAALELCGLEPSEDRVSYLAKSEPGVGFYRDLWDRHGLVRTGAGISEEMHLAMSTNAGDREKRKLAEADVWEPTVDKNSKL